MTHKTPPLVQIQVNDHNVGEPACRYECCKPGATDAQVCGSIFVTREQAPLMWSCTMPAGHDGPHVACGIGGAHAFKAWRDLPAGLQRSEG